MNLPHPSVAALYRLALTGALSLLLGMMILTRAVGLHWHAHLGHDASTEASADLHHGRYSLGPLHVADISTPHLAEDGDEDISLTGQLALQHASLALPAAIHLLLVWSWLAPPTVLVSTSPWAQAGPTTPPPRQTPSRLPPLRAPPALD